MAKILFKEEQYLRHGYSAKIILVSSMVVFIIFIGSLLQLLEVIPVYIAEDVNLRIFNITRIVSIVMIYFLITRYFANLKVIVTEEGLQYRFYRFALKKRNLSKSNIKQFEILKGDYLRKYGGWGIHSSKGVFIIDGDCGIKISNQDGKRIVLGTKKPKMFVKALDKLIQEK